ncbi:MAG TPA: peptidylprolyl isomerase [Saprospiraceae bacterium]|nr:peptidylprolyl isomerase [Saprospiraceae bacterium]
MHYSLNIVMVLAILFFMSSCKKGPEYVLIETTMGNMKIELYESTPHHKENFLKLVDEKYYDGLLFHRVIKGFMIQGGDPDSRNADPQKRLGTGGPGYTIPHEIGSPHFKGTLAAARQGDAINPEKKSSGSQFYIVQGNPVSEIEIGTFEQTKGIKYNDIQKKKYKDLGGTPALDGDYTVFGEVVEGLDVIDRIASVQTGAGDRPVEDIIMTIRRVKS